MKSLFALILENESYVLKFKSHIDGFGASTININRKGELVSDIPFTIFYDMVGDGTIDFNPCEEETLTGRSILVLYRIVEYFNCENPSATIYIHNVKSRSKLLNFAEIMSKKLQEIFEKAYSKWDAINEDFLKEFNSHDFTV